MGVDDDGRMLAVHVREYLQGGYSRDHSVGYGYDYYYTTNVYVKQNRKTVRH